ncbi:MAG: glycosyltransferase family 2 protein [Prosthecobacter sp.]|nr:glycosyltransferase family 2 protein [Prosthecobacter sp.]
MSRVENTLPVSVCIPVRNEAVNLPACLASLSDFAEVVVVDSGSTDQTAEIARQAGAAVLHFQWDGKFPKKRNWALRNHRFAHPWILFLDADERMNPAFVEELRQVLPTSPHVGFWISFTNWFMDKPLRHGDVFRKLALFRLGFGEYECFPEDSWSRLDMEVHEHPILKGSVGDLGSRLDHRDYRGLHNYLARHNEYSSWEANRFLWLQAAEPQAWQALNPRQRIKYKPLHRWWFGWFYWALAVVVISGFLDGREGLRLGLLKRRYFEEIRLKIIEARQRNVSAGITPSLNDN